MSCIVRDLTGQRFGRLKVFRFVGFDKHHKSTWMCGCDCGKEVVVQGRCMLGGSVLSCGCLKRDVNSQKAVARNKAMSGDKHPFWNGGEDGREKRKRERRETRKEERKSRFILARYKEEGGELKKRCARCEEWKPKDEFSKKQKASDGLAPSCKDCANSWYNAYYHNNPGVVKRLSENSRKYYHKKGRYNTQYMLRGRLRSRIADAIKYYTGRKKTGKTIDLIGCSIGYFKEYIESKFDENMSWENYGSYWNVDHIIPCRAFDLTQEIEQRKCFHYTNMQPLKKEENYSKGDRLPDGSRARHLSPQNIPS